MRVSKSWGNFIYGLTVLLKAIICIALIIHNFSLGGNEESDFPELQTAREWSDDDEGLEDDDACLSSSSVWGTPRQNSFELTFSYIAFSESDGSSRRDSGRRRTGGRGGRGSLLRTDTLETQGPPDSPAVEWDPDAFLTVEGEGDVEEESLQWTLEPQTHRVEEFQDKDTGTWEATEEISGIQTHNLACSHQDEQITGAHVYKIKQMCVFSHVCMVHFKIARFKADTDLN